LTNEKHLSKKTSRGQFDDSQSLRTESLWAGMNTEIISFQYISCERIDEGIIISSENHEDENPYLSDTLLVKTYGIEIDCV
jgi:hypothetical protein